MFREQARLRGLKVSQLLLCELGFNPLLLLEAGMSDFRSERDAMTENPEDGSLRMLVLEGVVGSDFRGNEVGVVS